MKQVTKSWTLKLKFKHQCSFLSKKFVRSKKNFVVALQYTVQVINTNATYDSFFSRQERKAKMRTVRKKNNNVIDYYPTLRNVIASWDLSLLLFPSYECIHKSLVCFPPNFSGYGISFFRQETIFNSQL